MSGSTSRRGGQELRVGDKYRLGKKIGHGSFGDIYLGNFFNPTSHSLSLSLFLSFLFLIYTYIIKMSLDLNSVRIYYIF